MSVFCFLVVAEIVLGDTYLPYQLCRRVFFFVAVGNSIWLHRSVFLLWWEIVLGVTSLPIVPTIFMDSRLSEICWGLALHYFPADCFRINFFNSGFFSALVSGTN